MVLERQFYLNTKPPSETATGIMKTWDANFYDEKHAFVSKYGLDLIALLEPKSNERILDLGCGTGVLSHEIATSGSSVVGLDSSPEMISQARARFPQLAFMIGDGQHFHFSEPFDAVFSNAALHWMPEPRNVIACVWENLKKGGRFVAEFGGKGNLEILLHAIAKASRGMNKKLDPDLTNYSPTIEEYSSLLEAQGFQITHALHFERMTPLEGEEGLRNWITMFRSSAVHHLSEKEREEFFSQVEKRARHRLYKNGVWYADYKRLRIRAIT